MATNAVTHKWCSGRTCTILTQICLSTLLTNHWKRLLLYFIVLLPGVKDPLYQSTLLEELRVQQKHRIKMTAEIIKSSKIKKKSVVFDLLTFSRQCTKTYICHKGIVDRGLWVNTRACLHCLPLQLRVRLCRIPIVVMEAWARLVLWRRVVQDSRHTQLHLEVQKIIPGVFKEQILYRDIKHRQWAERSQPAEEIESRTFLLWRDSAKHCTTMPPSLMTNPAQISGLQTESGKICSKTKNIWQLKNILFSMCAIVKRSYRVSMSRVTLGFAYQ